MTAAEPPNAPRAIIVNETSAVDVVVWAPVASGSAAGVASSDGVLSVGITVLAGL